MTDESKESNLLETPTAALVLTAASETMVAWSDTKKTEFVGTFKQRARVARFLLEATAFEICRVALNRKFISEKHLRVLGQDRYAFIPDRYSRSLFPLRHLFDAAPVGSYSSDTVGGRTSEDLMKIAVERASVVLDELPPLHVAVQIIDPDTAKLILQKDKLKQQGEQVKDQLDVVCETIELADLDQSMTIGSFRALVKERDKKRRQLIEQLQEIGREGSHLEETIAKKLYAGLPGLSDAVVDVVKTHFDRSTALDETTRRVEEQVKFGDSDAALALLRHFEKDEIEVSTKVKEQFAEAMATLKLSVKGPAKATKSVKKAKP